MAEFMQQLINLLLTPPGNLIYQLVLAFSIAGVLLSAFNQRRNSNFTQGKRVVIGLSLLLVIRLILFLAAAVTWRGMIDEHLLLPPIDRAVTVFSLVFIVWLWCFPKPNRIADVLTIVFGLLIIILSALNLAWWYYQGSADIPYNSFEANTIGDIFALSILAIGGLILIARRPIGWGFGLAMFVFLAAGHALSLAFPSPELDYSGVVRITQMAAYPLFFALPQRFLNDISHLPVPTIPYALEEHRHHGVDLHLLQSFLTLSVETEASKFFQAITLAVGHTMVADLCFLASPADEKNEVIFESGYDLIREEPFPGFTLKSRKVPVLTAAMQQNQALQISTSSRSSDLTNLARILNLASAGHLLAAPITDKMGEVMCMLVLLTPYSGRGWANEDQSTLVIVANSLAQILQRNLSQAPYLEEIDALQQKLQAAHQEVSRLSSQIKSYDSVIDQDSGVSAAGEQEPQQSVASFLAENGPLSEQATSQEAAPIEGSKMQEILAMKKQVSANEQLGGDLVLALEEIDRLNKTILDMEQAQREYSSQPGIQLTSGNKSEMYTSITQELSSPLSSINGYTDFLLAESFGSLGPIQRKFVERIKFSCDRINNILEVTPDSNVTLAERLQLRPEALDLQEIINSAIERTRFQMLEKKIALDRTRSQYLPTVYADRDALEQVLISLLENAIAVTPEEGKISFRTQKKETNAEQHKVLIQVSDQGGSGAARTTYQVFTSQPESSILNVNQEGIDMAMLKDLVEMQNGSIWIESDEGIGSTVNLVMPVSDPHPTESADNGTRTYSDGEIQAFSNGGIHE